MSKLNEAYAEAQQAVATLKSLVRTVLELAPESGLKNSEIGKSLGIYSGHVEHEGHISRTLLSMLEAEGVVQQDGTTKLWTLRDNNVGG
jgi:DNA-directed RNA polymerase specialized sigma24 family protein